MSIFSGHPVYRRYNKYLLRIVEILEVFYAHKKQKREEENLKVRIEDHLHMSQPLARTVIFTSIKSQIRVFQFVKKHLIYYGW